MPGHYAPRQRVRGGPAPYSPHVIKQTLIHISTLTFVTITVDLDWIATITPDPSRWFGRGDGPGSAPDNVVMNAGQDTISMLWFAFKNWTAIRYFGPPPDFVAVNGNKLLLYDLPIPFG